MKETIREQLLSWFAQHQRALPWRENRTPYRTWISEIMLQQTRVETVIPYFQRWMEEFPSIQSLADAEEQTILKHWEGLGYYSRARSIHKTSQVIMEQYNGELPSTAAELEKLPGIGRYTAGAIASMAFGVHAPALDGNIRRIFARLYNLPHTIGSKELDDTCWELSQTLTDPKHPGDFHEALMDLGSLICLPKNPKCLLCPLNTQCKSRQAGTTAERPLKRASKKTPHYTVTAAVIARETANNTQEYLITQRPASGLLAGLWEFPGGKQEEGETLEECLKREIREELDCDCNPHTPFGSYEHAYTHFSVTLFAFLTDIGAQQPKFNIAPAAAWVSAAKFPQYPMGKIDRQIADKIQNELEQNL